MSNPEPIALATAIETARGNVRDGNPTDPAEAAALLAGLDAQHAAIARMRTLAHAAVDNGSWTVAVTELDAILAAPNTGGM